jgi:26S proteasome regulatory subunit T4
MPAVRASRIVGLLQRFEGSLFKSSPVRFSLKDLEKEYEKTENDIKAVQSVGQIIGEVMKQLDDERCES